MILEVKNLTKAYVRDHIPFLATDDISVTVDGSEFVSIMGKSGSGKSTFINLVSGLLNPDKGTIILNGEDITKLKDRDVSSLRSSVLGYIPQGNSTIASLDVLGNVLLPYYLRNKSKTGKTTKKSDRELKARALEVLDRVGIAHLKNSLPSRLSGGELRRVAIARSLVGKPELLIADEPTSDLDPATTTEILDLFASINKEGTAIIMVTHDEDADAYANRKFTMEHGKLSDRASFRYKEAI